MPVIMYSGGFLRPFSLPKVLEILLEMHGFMNFLNLKKKKNTTEMLHCKHIQHIVYNPVDYYCGE